eukprot:gene36715-45290_t
MGRALEAAQSGLRWVAAAGARTRRGGVASWPAGAPAGRGRACISPPVEWPDARAAAAIPGALETVASFGVTVTDLQRWSGGVQLRYFGPRPLVEDNSVRSAATALAYARLGYKLGARTSVALDVFNLLDKRASDIDYYYASRLPGEAAEGVADRHFHPVEPRSFRLTLTHKF